MVKDYISEIDRLYFIAINYCFLKPHSKKSLLSGASQLLTFLLERFNNFKCPNKNSKLKWRVIFHYEDFLFKVIILCFIELIPSFRAALAKVFKCRPLPHLPFLRYSGDSEYTTSTEEFTSIVVITIFIILFANMGLKTVKMNPLNSI